MKKKIKLGSDFSRFLIPQSDVFTNGNSVNKGDLIKYKDTWCSIAEVNWITYKVMTAANHPKPIEYETKDLCWVW